MIVSFEKAKKFETLVKRVIMIKYGKMLPSDKISLLNNTEFINEDIVKVDIDKVYGTIIRKIVSSIIDVKCFKTLNVNENEEKEILYGEYLEKGLIEYYSREICNKFNLKLNTIPQLKDNLNMVLKLYERLGSGLDERVFKTNAIDILDEAKLNDLIITCDNKAIEDYMKKINQTEVAIDSTNIDAPRNGNGDILDNEGKVQIVYLNGKQYIKYIDKNDEVHLVESNDSKHVSDVYKKTMRNLPVGSELDSEAFFNELTSYIKEVDLNVKEDIKTDSLTSEEVNMMNFIHSNKELELDVNEDVVTHSSDQTIHVIESTNDIVVTEDKIDHVESVIISDNYTNEVNANELNGIVKRHLDEKILTPEEYEKLCVKFANNQELTLEELRALRRSTPEEMIKSQDDRDFMSKMMDDETSLVRNQSGPILAYPEKYKYGSAAFANKYMLIYVIIITICIGFVVGMLLFKLFGVN